MSDYGYFVIDLTLQTPDPQDVYDMIDWLYDHGFSGEADSLWDSMINWSELMFEQQRLNLN